MDTLKSMNVFRHIVENGSFTLAAERLGISTAMASKHLRHLEHHLHAKLLNRTSRRISLTDVGKQYYPTCVQALEILDGARKNAQQDTTTPSGELNITAPMWCSTPHFTQLLAGYQKAYPKVRLRLHLDSEHTDLISHGIDLALRVTNTPDEHLIVKPLTQIPFTWVAAPTYLAQYGMPNEDNWHQHLGLLATYITHSNKLQAHVSSNSAYLLYQFAILGSGIAYLPHWLIADDLKTGRLRIIHSPQNEEKTLYAVYLDRQFLSAKVRSFIDFLTNKV
ncbi:LysR family transcriptional regulator [Spirabiliibacterium falconis]|uniref:LysR family transcriptional regulator n=1 Tax=Spirabiliibacterium falconis TaxID=572023 RepID=UPI001AACFD61|nr:LysR family transcriptional regulator [Spirabiliibacterium falconis]MBE2894900.1 LysR family transcriptional regulator [Spirabiliibacterium falconis]